MNATLEVQGVEQTVSDDSEDNKEKNRTRLHMFFQSLAHHLSLSEGIEELRLLGKITCPIVITSLLMFSKSIISMIFLGRMGKVELAGGSLAMAFANVTGFSVMKGLSVAMDPICCQAYGAKRFSTISQTYLKTFLLLLFSSIPISLLWLNVEPVFLRLGQDIVITKVAKTYLMFSLPELLAHAHLNPLRSFLRTQSINSPASIAATCSTILHFPINYLFVTHWNLGVKGIALGSVCYTFNMNIGLLIYTCLSKVSMKPWVGLTLVSTFHGWWPLLSLAIPSVCSVCIEWWWYEIILFLGGLLNNPQSTIGAMGIMIQTTGTIYVVPYAISLSISQRIGHELGAGEAGRAKRVAITGIALAVAYGFTALGLAFSLRSVWGKMYTSDKQTLGLISKTLPVLGLAEVANAPQTACCGVLMGSAQPKVGARVNLASFYFVGLPVAVLLAFKFQLGFWGLWWGLVAAQHSCLVLMLYTLSQTDWRYQAQRAEDLTLAAGDDDVETNLVA